MKASRECLISQMIDALPVISTRLKIHHEALSSRAGMSRQTSTLIETYKQVMTWVTFMAMLGKVFVILRCANDKCLVCINLDLMNIPKFMHVLMYLPTEKKKSIGVIINETYNDQKM